MELKISDGSRANNKKRTAISQQSLVNSLLAEKQAVNYPQQNIQPVQPIQSWGGKK